jgi:hypothetical protein
MSEETKDKKTRGRPKGSHRPIYYVCFGLKNKKYFKDRIEAKTEDELREEFAAKYDDDTKLIEADGPFYEVAGLKTDTEDRASITLDFEDINFTNMKFHGEIRGWCVFCNGLDVLEHNGRIYEANELVRVNLTKPVDESKKVAKPRIKPGSIMRLKDIENVEEVS